MTSAQTLPASAWPSKTWPAPQTSDVLAQLTDFLEKLGYKKTIKALSKEATEGGINIDVAAWRSSQSFGPASESLDILYTEYLLQDVEEGSDSEDSSDDTSSEDSDSDSEEETVLTPQTESTAEVTSQKPKGASLKRSRDEQEESSDSDSDSDDTSSSDESEAEEPPAKRAKKVQDVVIQTAKVDSSEDTSESEDDSSESEDSDGSTTSTSDSDSSSEDDSSSDESVEVPPVVKATTKKAKTKTKTASTPATQTSDSISSASSGTLAGSPQPNAQAETMHPSRLQRMDPPTNSTQVAKNGKKINEPFSRIPKTTTVDPRFSSNNYVPYDYANRAYQDLSVTRGKGFTKEKNKKKRGSYRGGTIDITPKGIKFDD